MCYHTFGVIKDVKCQGMLLAVLLLACQSSAAAEGNDVLARFEGTQLNRCGPFALQACATFVGAGVHHSNMVASLPEDGQMTTFEQLQDAAKQLGLASASVRWHGRLPSMGGAPAILAIRKRGVPHFIAALDTDGSKVLLVEFPDAAWIHQDRLRAEMQWNGEALHVATSQVDLWWIYLAIHGRRAAIIVAFVIGIRIAYLAVTRSAACNTSLKWGTRLGALFLVALALIGCGIGPRAVDPEYAVRVEPPTVVIRRTDDCPTTHIHDAKELVTQERDFDMRIVNEGRQPVRLAEIKTSCTCTMVEEPSQTLISPGSELPITLRVQVPATGERHTQITIGVADSAGKRAIKVINLPVTLVGRPIEAPAIIGVPQLITLNRDSTGIASALVRIRTVEKDSRPWIGHVSVSDPLVVIEHLGTEDDSLPQSGTVSRIYSYSIKAEPMPKSKQLDAEATCVMMLQTASGTPPIAVCPIRVCAWRPVQVFPSSLFIDAPTVQEGVEREVKLLVTDRRFVPERIVVESDCQWIEVRDASLKEGLADCNGVISLRVRQDNLASGEALAGKITVRVFGAGTLSVETVLPVIMKAH